MNNLEFVLDASPWETAFEQMEKGSTITATRFLALFEGETEETAKEALLDLEEKGITLDIRDLPAFRPEGATGERLLFEEKLAKGDRWIEQLEETDSLRLCLEELAMIPVCGDIRIMAENLTAGDENARQSIINLMMSKVVNLAKEYTGRGVLLLDLIQNGNLGLLVGLEQYTGGDMEDYCTWWIRQYMAGCTVLQAKADGIGQKLRSAMSDYRDVDQKLLTELGRNPTAEEMAEALHMTPQQIVSVAEMLENAELLQRVKNPEKATETPEEENLAVEDTAYFQMRQRIADLLAGLPEEDAKLLTLRYGLEGGVPMKPQQVAIRMGITADEVNMREAAALMKLRQ